MKPSISSPCLFTQPSWEEKQSSHSSSNDSGASKLTPVRANSDTLAYHGLHNFFASEKKINGQTHSERILVAAEGHDLDALKDMIKPGKEGTDSLRKLSTAAGSVIGARYDEYLKASFSAKVNDDSKHIDVLKTRYQEGKLDQEGKRLLIRALAYQAFTSPILKTKDGSTVTFGQLGNTTAWESVTESDLERSNIVQELKSVLADLKKAYEVAASFPQNKPPVSPAVYSRKDKGLRKLWKETKNGNFSEAKRQAEKFTHKLDKLFNGPPYEDRTLDDVFGFQLNRLKPAEREEIEKKILQNQVKATKTDLEKQPHDIVSPGKIAKIIKQKKNYQYIAYKDKDAYLAGIVEDELRPPPTPDTAGSSVKDEQRSNGDAPSVSPSSDHEDYDSPDLQEARNMWRKYDRLLGDL